jgi:hypothetical protein
MDPIHIYSAVAAGERNLQQLTSTRNPSRTTPRNSTRPWRPGAARMLRRLAERLDAAPR